MVTSEAGDNTEKTSKKKSRKKRLKPHLVPPEPITAENYRHDEEIKEFLESQGHVLDAPRPEIVLSDEQQAAKALIVSWLSGPSQIFRLGGYAGAGKTTLIKALIEELGGQYAIAVSAFTGKACNVLRTKGVPSQTLHSLLYIPEYDSFTKKMRWVPKAILPYDLVIVDEASMVSTDLYDDLRRHGCKLLFVGDPGQLEPVGDNPNLMRNADFVMEKIHRQAAKSPIIRLAQAVRQGMQNLPIGEWKNDTGSLIVTDSMFGIDLATYDMIICARNSTRHALNIKRRVQLGKFGDPSEGETVICLKNDNNKSLFNGMLLTVDKVLGIESVGGKTAIIADLKDDAGDSFQEVPMRLETFGKDYKMSFGDRSPAIPFDFGYAITCHKSQGSESRKVLVFDEFLPNTDRNRWRYTAFTRSQSELTVVLSR